MTDHIRLLGDEVEASKWVGYARSRTSGSLTSPIPGVTVRVNKLGSMNQILISAEGGGIIWVYGFKTGSTTIPFRTMFAPTGLPVPVENISRWFSGGYSNRLVIWGKNEYFGAFGGYSWGTFFEGTSVPNILFLVDLFSPTINDFFWVGEQTLYSSNPIQVNTAGFYNGKSYIQGYYLIDPNNPGPGAHQWVFETVSGETGAGIGSPFAFSFDDTYIDGIAYHNTQIPIYEVPLPVFGGNGTGAVGAGPTFLAFYWRDANQLGSAQLLLYAYNENKLLYSWTPTSAQEKDLLNITTLAAGSKYIAALSGSNLFVWHIEGDKLILVSETDISKIINPVVIAFDMKAAYEGKV